MARSPDFGSYLINSRFLRLAFTTPTFTNLSSLIKYTRRPIMQKVQCHNHLRMQVTATYASQYLVSELFNASPWPLFTFPSQYSFTFGYLGFLGLVSGLTFSYFFFFFVRFIVLYIYIFLQAKLLVLRLTQLLHGYDRYWDSYPLWLSYFKLILLSHMEHTYFMLFGATYSLNRFRSPLLTASTHLSFPHSY